MVLRGNSIFSVVRHSEECLAAMLETTKTVPSWIHSKAGKPVDAEMLEKRWLIPAKHAVRTVNRTSQ